MTPERTSRAREIAMALLTATVATALGMGPAAIALLLGWGATVRLP